MGLAGSDVSAHKMNLLTLLFSPPFTYFHSQVSKHAADIILMDDAFGSIVLAIHVTLSQCSVPLVHILHTHCADTEGGPCGVR
jgi:hypothetical protein